MDVKRHYTKYSDEKNIPIYLAYGFRPIFLLLAPYIVISSILWAFSFSGLLPLFTQDILTWHIYEFLYGIGTAGIIAFLLTGLPEMYPGIVPIVGKRLGFVVFLWLLGRVTFWLIDYINIYIVFLCNISILIWIVFYVFKPVILDKNQKHSSIAYTIILLLVLQVLFFLSQSFILKLDSISLLKISVNIFMILILLALRRVNMEAINELMEEKNINGLFLAKSFRYNFAIFNVLLFTIIEYFYPDNTVLGWIGFACFCSILSILNDYILKDECILFEPYVVFLSLIIICMALGYGFLGFDILDESIYALNHFRHFLTSGAFSLAFFVIMVVMTVVHTGRELTSNIYIGLGVFFILLSTILRVLIPYYLGFSTFMYSFSSILWALAFVCYIIKYFPYLLSRRADGELG